MKKTFLRLKKRIYYPLGLKCINLEGLYGAKGNKLNLKRCYFRDKDLSFGGMQELYSYSKVS